MDRIGLSGPSFEPITKITALSVSPTNPPRANTAMNRQAGPSIVLSVLIVCFFAVALFQRDPPRASPQQKRGVLGGVIDGSLSAQAHNARLLFIETDRFNGSIESVVGVDRLVRPTLDEQQRFWPKRGRAGSRRGLELHGAESSPGFGTISVVTDRIVFDVAHRADRRQERGGTTPSFGVSRSSRRTKRYRMWRCESTARPTKSSRCGRRIVNPCKAEIRPSRPGCFYARREYDEPPSPRFLLADGTFERPAAPTMGSRCDVDQSQSGIVAMPRR